MNHAYSLLEVKAIDREQRIIEGLASTPEVDRGGDEMDPMGAEFRLPQPFLWFHDALNPIGEVFEATPTLEGIYIKARVSRVTVPGRLKTLTDEAWAAFTAVPMLVRGLSIGWSLLQAHKSATGRKVSRWIWAETSAVTIPMNAGATILSVKSFDRSSALAASGTGARPVPSFPGVTGTSRVNPMNISEQLTKAESDKQSKSTRLEELLTDEVTNGGLEADEITERDALLKDVADLTVKVKNFRTLEEAQATNTGTQIIARPPTPTTRQVVQQIKTVELPPATIFIRAALAVAAGRGSRADTIEYAKQFTNTPEVLAYIKGGYYMQKAEAGTAVIASPSWGGELVNPGQVSAEFIALLMPRTIIGRVTGFDEIPFNTLIIEQTGGSTFNWVGELAPKPVGELAFDRTTLTWSKVAGIVVMSEELVRLSTPKAEEKARMDMIKQCAKFIDQQFIRVAVAAGANNPASITNGVASPAATGATAAALRHDLNIALANFDTSNEDDASNGALVIVMTPALARGISLLTTSLGVPEFPSMNPQGGTLLGYPVIVSSSVDSGTIVIFKPSEIYLADDGRVTLDASREATLDMSGGSSPTFNLWQNNAVGLRAERWIRWQKKRTTGVVAIIDTAAYAPA